jgi:hypothetical protein
LTQLKQYAQTPNVAPVHPEVVKFMAENGKKTKGKKVPSRSRGDSAYYSELAKRRVEKQRAKE